uniref:AIG1-type G domain-containing protein n=1 Tax=Cyprinus carpio carpio TaxID=630221 RepID=A0A8C1E3D4_CYPCA
MEAGEDSDYHDNYTALPEIKAIIIGSKAEYKCTAANTILSHTDWKVGKEIVKSEMKQTTIQNRSVTLVMTPGWWRSFTLAESTKYIQMEIVHSLKHCPDPHAFLLVISLHKPFTDMHLKSVVEHMEIFERLVAEHQGQCFKIDSKLLEDMEEKRSTMEKQAKERENEVKTKMQSLKKCLTERSCGFPELRIVLMGGRFVGKTSVMNTILKIKQEFSNSKKCVMREGEVDKRKVILIDTPGWWPYASVKETSESVKQEIMSSVTMCPPGPHAVLLVLQSDVAFSEAQSRSVKEHMELLGQNVWKYCIVVFTRGDWRGTSTIEEHIESEGETLQMLINKCGNRYHILNNMQWDDGIQVRELMEKVEMMARGNTDLLTPVEAAMEETDSGWGSNWSDQDKLERGSLKLDPPNMHDDKVKKWLENIEIVSNYRTSSDFSQDILEDESR